MSGSSFHERRYMAESKVKRRIRIGAAQRTAHRVFSLNVGTVVFCAILLYIIVSLLLFLTRNHISYYQVRSGPLTRNTTYTGLALRSEQIITTDTSGYVTYYAQGSSRVRKSGMLFGIGPQRSQTDGDGMSELAKRGVYETIRNFSLNYDSNDYSDVYSLKYDVTGKIVSDTPILSDEMQAMTLRSQGTYTLGTETITACPKDGIVVYSLDGYEGFDVNNISEEDFDKKNYRQTDLRTGEKMAAGDAVCKLIDSEKWSLVIPLTSLQIVRLDGISRIRVKFLKDSITQLADLTILPMEDGSYYGKLDFEDGMIRYVGDRYVDIELVTNTQTGLKIPISSIVSKEFFTIPESFATESGEGGETTIGFMKEARLSDGTMSSVFVSTTLYEHRDGKYYIDSTDFKSGDVIVTRNSESDRYTVRATDTLEGVYCTNKGYAVFRKIVILDKNEEYCIVEAGTRYGISQFDYIVLNSDEVKEEQIIVRKS